MKSPSKDTPEGLSTGTNQSLLCPSMVPEEASEKKMYHTGHSMAAETSIRVVLVSIIHMMHFGETLNKHLRISKVDHLDPHVCLGWC